MLPGELGLPDITTAVNSTDRTTIQFSDCESESEKNSVIAPEWPQLSKEYSFTLVSGQEGYPLPGDIDHVFRTNWDRQNHWELEGHLTPKNGSLERAAFLKLHRGGNSDSAGQ